MRTNEGSFTGIPRPGGIKYGPMASSIHKVNPATGDLLAEVPCVAPADVPALVQRARRAQGAWAAQTPRARGKKIRAVAAVLAHQAESVSELISQETGKPVVEALMQEVFNAAHLADYFGRRAAAILAPRSVRLSVFLHRRSYLHYVPRGVVAVISPWNFPLSLALGDVIMALVAGNAVVLKPSEHTPLCGLRVRQLVEEAGIDPELVQIAVGHGDVGAALVQSDINMVHFTGSVATGQKIAAAAGARLVPCVLELGGKDAAIVLEDADIEHAARTLCFGAFLNAGQACASVERVYAVGAAYEPLVKRVVQLASALHQGDGTQADVDVGPMIVNSQLDIVQRHVQEARDAGATIRVGGTSKGQYFAPTVLTEVNDSMAICRDETFGPVLPVMRVDSLDEAVRRANDTMYGLSAYVFTRNGARGLEVAERLQAGTVDVNDVLFTHAAPETPWGGLKHSGIGHTHSDDGVRHMCETRHVNYSPFPAFPNLWLFPYRRALVGPCADVLRGWFGNYSVMARLGYVTRGLTQALAVLRAPRTR